MYTYDKAGNIKTVSLPVNGKGEPVQPHTTTATGAIPANVGHSLKLGSRKTPKGKGMRAGF